MRGQRQDGEGHQHQHDAAIDEEGGAQPVEGDGEIAPAEGKADGEGRAEQPTPAAAGFGAVEAPDPDAGRRRTEPARRRAAARRGRQWRPPATSSRKRRQPWLSMAVSASQVMRRSITGHVATSRGRGAGSRRHSARIVGAGTARERAVDEMDQGDSRGSGICRQPRAQAGGGTGVRPTALHAHHGNEPGRKAGAGTVLRRRRRGLGRVAGSGELRARRTA